MRTDTTTIHLLGPDRAEVLDRIAAGVFDGPVNPEQVRAFLCSAHHMIAGALADGTVVAMATGLVHLHPDKPPQLWLMEVGTAEAWQRRGLATRCIKALLEEGRARGCAEAWVATESDNLPARALYRTLAATETEGIVMYDWGSKA